MPVIVKPVKPLPDSVPPLLSCTRFFGYRPLFVEEKFPKVGDCISYIGTFHKVQRIHFTRMGVLVEMERRLHPTRFDTANGKPTRGRKPKDFIEDKDFVYVVTINLTQLYKHCAYYLKRVNGDSVRIEVEQNG